MIIQIGTDIDESRILWKYKESDEWKRADIDDLIRAYEKYNQLTTEDEVKVVYCKDCKFRRSIDFGIGDCLNPRGTKHIAFDYHYCSYGERREK